ncbi:zinc dependent phospholipase C family protein [Anaeromyxobacter soli]|uniref:zinc dependent phospholipase C family protein n=1 Tax=Anaeromyxobacter soli TaxID=2922725 RepID=UPI001FAFB592|nr:zinc dependent phospholipase C family protein [Anaeromyxobacter sp. SG29]
MPGAYAHLTLVAIAREPAELEAAGVSEQAIVALLDFAKYCELGAVSPDYPYLAITHPAQKEWADAMHYVRTREVISSGITRLRTMQGDAARKCLAWLLGYAAHVTTDMTIHPVVEKKVGPYRGNELQHRICEMHQDAYIFQRLELGGIEFAEYLDHGIAACSSPSDHDRLDGDVATLWTQVLGEVYAGTPMPQPDPDAWHRGFRRGVDKFAESGRYLFPLARHVAQGHGLVYPLKHEIDRQFIDDLLTPSGARLPYDLIFDRAVANVRAQWALIAAELAGGPLYASAGGTWNLDTGRDGDRYVFWEVA